MSRYDYGVRVAPRSRKQIRNLAYAVRRKIGISDIEKFPIMRFLELILPRIYDDFVLEIVPVSEMKNEHGNTIPSEHAIKIREDVYKLACQNDGFALYTIAHEIGHLLLHAEERAFARIAGEQLPLYANAEWQADAFAGELLMPYNAIFSMTPRDISRIYGVTITAARTQSKSIHKQN